MSSIPLLEVRDGSLLGLIRSQQRDLAKGKTIDIPIAGYHRPELVARYRFLDMEEGKLLGERIRKQFDDDVDKAEALLLWPMIEACEGLFARQGDKLEPVELPDGGGPCRYDGRLETFFGVPDAEHTGTAKGALLVAFKGNGHAAIKHGRVLAEWFGDTSKTIDQLLGEA
jgi:hypothetical protein